MVEREAAHPDGSYARSLYGVATRVCERLRQYLGAVALGARILSTVMGPRKRFPQGRKDWVSIVYYNNEIAQALRDLTHKESDRKLSLVQQVFAIVSNIRGNVGYRLGHVSSFLHAGMTRDKFGDMVDYILNMIDPLDKETAFL
eukprot:IDg796t1